MTTETTTYPRMTVEHLGSDATDIDLELFQLACAIAHGQSPADSAGAITDWMWGDGDWLKRALPLINERYPHLSIDDQATVDAWRAQ